jgi:hypothetical protein
MSKDSIKRPKKAKDAEESGVESDGEGNEDEDLPVSPTRDWVNC